MRGFVKGLTNTYAVLNAVRGTRYGPRATVMACRYGRTPGLCQTDSGLSALCEQLPADQSSTA